MLPIKKLYLIVRGLIAIILGLLFTDQLGSKPDISKRDFSKGFSSAYLDKTSNKVGEQIKRKSTKRTKVSAVKIKRTKVKGLKASQLLASENLPLKIYEYNQIDSGFIQVVYVSFLYCVKYKRGPPFISIPKPRAFQNAFIA